MWNLFNEEGSENRSSHFILYKSELLNRKCGIPLTQGPTMVSAMKVQDYLLNIYNLVLIYATQSLLFMQEATIFGQFWSRENLQWAVTKI